MTLFNISVDQFIYPHNYGKKFTHRYQLDAELDRVYERDYIIMKSTAESLKEAKNK